MVNAHYHTVIIGAGPAGLACALTLFEQGINDVLVVEKHRFPRDKCCAGYITKKTHKKYESFGLNTSDCGYSLIKDFRLYYKLKCVQRIENRFLLTSREINRVKLDDSFFHLAKTRGVHIEESLPITGHDPKNNTVTLGKEHCVEYENLVFADGTMGFGSSYQNIKCRNLAMQLIFPNNQPDGIEIHFGITKRGYCWVSTFNGITNVGMTDRYHGTEDYRTLLRRFLSEHDLQTDVSGLHAAFTPVGVRKPIIGHNIYYAGDALGACDPFTLSGVYNGLVSGEKVALSIAKSDKRILKCYTFQLRVKFLFTRLLMKMFYLPCILWAVFNIGSRFLNVLVAFFFNRFLTKK